MSSIRTVTHDTYARLSTHRAQQITNIAIYGCTLVAGMFALCNLPTLIIYQFGPFVMMTFGLFLATGSLISIVATAFDNWWLERVGIILLLTSIMMYGVILIYLKSATIAICIITAYCINLTQRWIRIRIDGRT